MAPRYYVTQDQLDAILAAPVPETEHQRALDQVEALAEIIDELQAMPLAGDTAEDVARAITDRLNAAWVRKNAVLATPRT